MTISPDTIRTVIEIVPDWATRHKSGNEFLFYPPDCGDDEHLSFCSWHYPQWILDALAAAAVRVVDEMEPVMLMINPGVTQIVEPDGSVTAEGPNRTNNTLEAIAEFVKGGGFDG